MKFHLNQPNGYFFTGIGSDYVEINRIRYHDNLVALPNKLIIPWGAQGFHRLAAQDMESLIPLKPEVILFGTGSQFRFPDHNITKSLRELTIGLEVMDNAAVCRTFNVLSAENRQVAAIILFS